MSDATKQVLHAGKTAEEMTREELITCALHFRDAHVKAVFYQAAMLRRIAKLEEGYTKDEIANLDDWLRCHSRDPEKGDGSEKYVNWRQWKRKERFGGLRPHYGKKDMSWD